MELDLNVLRPQERAALQLRLLYEREGFQKYHMGRFEEYGLYQENRRFLSSEQVITFTDLDGRLLALKPDVTLSIAKNAQVAPGGCGRYYYQENVYRPSQESHTFREISQMGLECIGAVDGAAAAQVVSLALRSLALTEREAVLEISHMGFVTGLFDAVGAGEAVRPKLLTCIRDKNVHELRRTAEAAGLSRQGTDALCRLGELAGPWREVLAAAEPLALNAPMGAALEELGRLCQALEDGGQTENWKIDLSLVESGAIPPMAEVVPAYRLVLGEVSSEWVQKGVFFIDTRSADALTGVLTIHGYDAMLKAEQVWEPDQSLVFPMTMERASAEIARLMGVSIDPRTVFQPSYLVDYPANAYTLRDVLRYIAAAYAGNWIITDTGQLRLVTFAELPPESSFLITGYGSAITFGGVRILV